MMQDKPKQNNWFRNERPVIFYNGGQFNEV